MSRNRSRSKKATLINPRVYALTAIAVVLDDHANLPADLPGTVGMDARDRALGRHLAFNVLRWLVALDWLAGRLISRPLKKRDQDVYRLILLGLAQLWHDRTASHAAVNETAECARVIGKPWAVGLVNAVLRRFQREREQWLSELDKVPERWAHPHWLLKRLQAEWPEDWQAIVQANNEQPPMWLRINRSAEQEDNQIPVDDSFADQALDPALQNQLAEQGFSLTHHSASPEAVRIEPPAAVDSIPGFRQGLLSVQDAAAQLAAHLLEIDDEAGLNVLDACAAPGGKTCHLLETHPLITLTAVDVDESRLALIRDNLKRLKLNQGGNCTLIGADAADTDSWWNGELFDRILLDAPCSATGVIRRHPEIRHLRQEKSIRASESAQTRLLRQLWPLVKPGGMLVYATCSILGAENSTRIAEFLNDCPDAEESPIKATWGTPTQHGRQILPGQEGMDGFYYARLRKTA